MVRVSTPVEFDREGPCPLRLPWGYIPALAHALEHELPLTYSFVTFFSNKQERMRRLAGATVNFC